jgi:hypothetical protein
MKDVHTWFGEVRAGESIAIGDGIKLRVEEKSGQRARIRLDFTKPTTVTKVIPAMSSFAKAGVRPA